jgi:hypothetical protein
MSEPSLLAKLLQERKAKAQAQEALNDAKRKKLDEIAAEVPRHWARAEIALHGAIDNANKDFADAGSTSRFQFNPLPQPGAGNHAQGLLMHSGNGAGDFSVSEIVAASDGRVIARRQGRTGAVLKVFEASKIGAEDWNALIVQIFRADVPG